MECHSFSFQKLLRCGSCVFRSDGGALNYRESCFSEELPVSKLLQWVRNVLGM